MVQAACSEVLQNIQESQAFFFVFGRGKTSTEQSDARWASADCAGLQLNHAGRGRKPRVRVMVVLFASSSQALSEL